MKFSRMSHEARLAWLGSQIIETPDVKRVNTLCDRLHRQTRTKNEGNGGFILGETGSGKSTAVAAFTDDLYSRLAAKRPNSEWHRPESIDTPILPIFEIQADSGWIRHVVVIVVPPRPRFNSFLRSVAATLGVQLRNHFDFGEAIDQIKTQIALQKVSMMIFDEAQHFVEGTIDSYQAADVIKIIMKCRVQAICIGLPNMLNLVEGEKANEQLLRLRQKQVEVTPLKCSLDDFVGSDGTARKKGDPRFADTPFTKFCEALDARDEPEKIILPFDQSSAISSPFFALRLWRAGGGRVGKVMELLFQATDLAIEKGMPKLTLPILEAVCRQNGINDQDNWFKMEVPEFLRRFEGDKRVGNKNEADGAQRSRYPANPLRKKR